MNVAVIMDMDGLMLDTEPISLLAWREAARDFGCVLDDGLCNRMIGLNATDNGKLLRQHFGEGFPVSELAMAANARYRQRLDADGIPLKPGLSAFVRFLDMRAIPRAVATSTATDLAAHKLRQAGVLQHFEVLVGGDQVARGKPAPDIFLLAAARLGCSPAECAVLEDSEPGIRAAVSAGMTSILIPDGRLPSRELREAAHAVVDSLFAAQILIDKMIASDEPIRVGARRE